MPDGVLQQQPEEVRTFLLQTAILDRLSSSLCDTPIRRSNGDTMLAHLEAANLFAIPLNEDRRWYRYDHLFTDLLRSQVTSSQPNFIPKLHRCAELVFDAKGNLVDAATRGFLRDLLVALAKWTQRLSP